VRLATRPWIIAGVWALASASVTTAPPAAVASLAVQTPAVQLTSFDPNDWNDVLQLALANATDIYDHWSPAPSPALQQVIVNQVGYLEEVLKDPSKISDIPTQIQNNVTAAYNAAIDPFTPANPEPYIYPSLDTTSSEIGISALGLHLFDIDLPGKADLLNILINGLSFEIGICPGPLCTDVTIPVLQLLLGDTLASQVEPYLNFSGSPLSGVLWGDFGTLLSPALQLNTDITGIVAALSGSNPDYATALDDLLNVPANLTNAFLNGYGDYDVALSSGSTLDVDLGGLLSPAGSLINALGYSDTLGDCSIACATFDVPTTAVGPIASMVELSQAIAEAIGWSGVGNPIDALASLF
jgi:hypothetical protein